MLHALRAKLQIRRQSIKPKIDFMRIIMRFRIFFSLLFVFTFLQTDVRGRTLQSDSGLVVADSELASEAGMVILKRGGNAVDAAIATALALSVVDQASSGLGGGGFMVFYRAKDKQSFALDFRETAPAASKRELYMKDGKPMASLSLTGALAVAVPGEVAGLIEAGKRFGSLPLSVVAAPAIKLASQGFPIDSALGVAIERQQANMKRFPDLGRIYMPNGEVPKDGETIRQPQLAEALRAIAQKGEEVFYRGWIAEAIVEAIKNAGGVMTLDDLKNYQSRMAQTVDRHLSRPHRDHDAAAKLGWRSDHRNAECSRRLSARRVSAQFRLLSASARRDDEACLCRSGAISRRPDFVHVPVAQIDGKKLRRMDSQTDRAGQDSAPGILRLLQFSL